MEFLRKGILTKRQTINGQGQELVMTELNSAHPLVQDALPGFAGTSSSSTSPRTSSTTNMRTRTTTNRPTSSPTSRTTAATWLVRVKPG